MKAKRWLSCVFALVMSAVMLGALAGCGEPANPDTPGGGGTVDDPNSVTVKWYDGRTVIKEEKVTKGSKVTVWTPEKEGWDFKGWFAEASFAQPFNEESTITKNTAIFARWRTQNPDPDTRYWYIRGAVMNSKWLQMTNYSERNERWEKTMEKNEDKYCEPLFFKAKEGEKNVFYVDVLINASGNNNNFPKFRFVTNMTKEDWTSDYPGCAQMGLGNLNGFEYAAGNNPEKAGAAVKSADLYLYGEVKGDDGSIPFRGGYEYNMPAYTWNIWTNPEMGGVYRFVFTSYPGNETTHEVSWARIAYYKHDFVDKDSVNDHWRDTTEMKGTPNGRCDVCGRTEAEHATNHTPAGPKNTEWDMNFTQSVTTLLDTVDWKDMIEV